MAQTTTNNDEALSLQGEEVVMLPYVLYHERGSLPFMCEICGDNATEPRPHYHVDVANSNIFSCAKPFCLSRAIHYYKTMTPEEIVTMRKDKALEHAKGS